ncbi:Ig-like domain-containing protein, partial [Vibrio natriegens]|uniref:Ig-like domain-containing protein n=1 Tax=Vibrio natriegens TaxID=691 RepID=UPI001EFE8921
GVALQDTATLNVTAAAISSIDVTPATSSVPAGSTQQFTATATMTDGTTPDITDDPATSWTSSDTSIATITSSQASGNGLATGVTADPTAQTITASARSMSGTAQLTVTDAELLSIEVEPASVTVEAGGGTATLTAWGTYTDTATPADRRDITADVGWTGHDTTYATVVGGTVTGVTEGTTQTHATLGSISSNNVDITVTRPRTLVSISIDQGPVIELSDRTPEMPLTVTGTYDDSSTGDVTDQVTWSISKATIIDSSTRQTRITRAEMSGNTVRAQGDEAYELIISDPVVTATVGTVGDQANILRCTTTGTTAQRGSCILEYDNVVDIDGHAVWGGSVAGLQAYGVLQGSTYNSVLLQVQGDPKLRSCVQYSEATGRTLRPVVADDEWLFNYMYGKSTFDVGNQWGLNVGPVGAVWTSGALWHLGTGADRLIRFRVDAPTATVTSVTEIAEHNTINYNQATAGVLCVEE